MIRIFLADDHAMMRAGLVQLLSSDKSIEVVGEASSGQEALDNIARSHCTLFMTDMSMPGLSGANLIERIHHEYPELPILVVSMFNTAKIAAAALKAGASGYLAKDSDPAMLIEAIHRLSSGGRYIDPSIAEAIAFNQQTESRPHERLTDREMDILLMITAGKSLIGIASDLNISPKTVSAHKGRIMEKLKIDNNADLIRYASDHL